jgi:hypothetical protein
MSARDKATKFVELANKRVNRAIKDIQLVGNLANRQNYEFTDEQAKKILKALQQEIETLRQSFMSTSDASRNDFKL